MHTTVLKQVGLKKSSGKCCDVYLTSLKALTSENIGPYASLLAGSLTAQTRQRKARLTHNRTQREEQLTRIPSVGIIQLITG
jgi:hypothetical protein